MNKKYLYALIVSAILCGCGSTPATAGTISDIETEYFSIDSLISQETDSQSTKEEKYFQYLEQVIQTNIQQLKGIETANIHLDHDGTDCTVAVTLTVNDSYTEDLTASIEDAVRTALNSYEIKDLDISVSMEEGTPQL